MSDNAFERIMASLETADDGVAEKTASEQPAPDTSARMLQTVKNLSRANQQAKTAAAKPPGVSGDLQRMAKEAQASENEQMLKQAEFMGAAVCDGFMARFAQYDSALSAAGHKTASVAPGQPSEEYVQKVAEAAYAKAVDDMQKTAAAEYQKGYDDTLEYVHKVASDMHYIGQQAARALIDEGRKQ